MSTKKGAEKGQKKCKDEFHVVHQLDVQHIGPVPIYKGDFSLLPYKVQAFIAHYVEVMTPRAITIVDGSEDEAEVIIGKLMERGTLERLNKYKNCYICRTDPADVARVESKTWISTDEKYETVPHVMEGKKGIMGQWISPDGLKAEMKERFPGCMAGRMMYVIPFSMGPVGSPLSKIGVEITDSMYVILCMRLMTRVTPHIWTLLGDDDFVKCVHSIGCPRPCPRKVINHWPCNPEKILIGHFPAQRKIVSYGSGYGGNSLLGKKCFALRIASVIAKDEGWLAEHMLIMSVTTPEGKECFLSAAFPSACGKTNLAMIQPGLSKFKVECVGDDIAWMRFNEKGELRGINPEAGFFGVAPGTNMKTNPNAMRTFQENSIFTNVAQTDDGGYFWEGLEDEMGDDWQEQTVTTWLRERKKLKDEGKKSHPNARFTAPASQCPIIHKKWEDPAGVPISAFIFGGRRPEGVPLVVEAFNWEHGILLGACVKSEATAAAEFKGKVIMHDPMAMRPFMGYNFGKYLEHWISMKKDGRKLPRVFHVNWFRVDDKGHFLWPGFGENIRVLDWIIRRCNGEEGIAVKTPIGYIPTKESFKLDGLEKPVDWEQLFSLPKDYWLEDVEESRTFFKEQVGSDMPAAILKELDEQEARLKAM